MRALHGKVALVTGASRGVGRGAALGLAEAGALVYITGRTATGESNHPEGLSGSLEDTAKQIEELGGQAIPIVCDHRNEDETKRAFARIERDNGRLDILVNAAWAGYEKVFDPERFTWTNQFWEQPLESWDAMAEVGLRSSFIASQCAARMMVKNRTGLIVNISYWAAQKYMGNVPYGVVKCATDRMTEDCALELKDYQVAVVSLYPGLVRTERVMRAADYFDMRNSESEQFTGRALAALAASRNIMEKSGTFQVAAALALEYGFADIDGKRPKPLTMDKAV